MGGPAPAYRNNSTKDTHYMKKLLTFAVMFVCIGAFAQIGGTTWPSTAMRYGHGSGTWFSVTGTASTLGYTNTSLVPVEIGKATTVSIGAYVVGADANVSNAITLRVWKSLDGVNKCGATAAAGTVAAAAAGDLIWNIVPAGATPVSVYTNISAAASGASIAQMPYMLLQLENPKENPRALTNVVITVIAK